MALQEVSTQQRLSRRREPRAGRLWLAAVVTGQQDTLAVQPPERNAVEAEEEEPGVAEPVATVAAEVQVAQLLEMEAVLEEAAEREQVLPEAQRALPGLQLHRL